jgi:hypothetical protein
MTSINNILLDNLGVKVIFAATPYFNRCSKATMRGMVHWVVPPKQSSM